MIASRMSTPQAYRDDARSTTFFEKWRPFKHLDSGNNWSYSFVDTIE